MDILYVLVSLVTIALGQQGFCEDYVQCMERLEAKQSDCLQIEQNYKHRTTKECTAKRWEVKLQLNGLHMRRAELARDCVQKNLAEAKVSESTLTSDMKKKCSSLHKKLQFAPGISSRRKRSNHRRAKRSSRRSLRLSDCRSAAKSWHKQCAAFAHCCPLTEDCKLDTADIMQQIFEQRRKLRIINDECEHQ